MRGEATNAGYARFFAYLNLFLFAMLVLVLAENFVLMFVGWEGVGLCSYLLVGYYFDREYAAAAGTKAFVVNRIGDYGFLLGMFGIFTAFGSLELFGGLRRRPRRTRAATPRRCRSSASASSSARWARAPRSRSTSGCRTRWPARRPSPPSSTPRRWSRPASTWSPAATCSSGWRRRSCCSWPVIGCFTALFAATIAIAQNDLKKVLAYSTISQLGYMFLACGVGAFTVGMFHVMTHAFFKACLFLGAGCVMHAHAATTWTSATWAGSRRRCPITYATFLIATLAISGIPPFAGFFSKDAILAERLRSARAARQGLLGDRPLHRRPDGVLHVPRRLAHVPRKVPRHAGAGAPPPRGAPLDDRSRSSSWPFCATVGGWVGLPAVFGENANLFARFLSPIVTPIAGREPGTHALPHAVEWLLMAVSVAVAASGLYPRLGVVREGGGPRPGAPRGDVSGPLRPRRGQVPRRRALRRPLRAALRVAGARPLEGRGRPHHRRRPERRAPSWSSSPATSCGSSRPATSATTR